MSDINCKKIGSVETDNFSLHVVECDCGFHLGVDAAWRLDRTLEKGWEVQCPSCNNTMYIESFS